MNHWIIYSTDSFKRLIHSGTKHLTVLMSESLNHLFNRFIQTTDSFRNKTFDCVNEWITESFIQPIHSNDWFIQEQSIWLWLYPKSPPIPSFTSPYISPLIQFTWRSEWKRVSEFGHWVHWKDCRFCIVCLLFINNMIRAAPVVRLKDLSWTLSRKLCINSNSQFTINLYLCCITLYYAVDECF